MSMLAANSLRGWWTTVYFTLLDSRSIQSAANVVRDERRVKLNKIELPCVCPSPGEGVSHPRLLTSVYLLVARFCPGLVAANTRPRSWQSLSRMRFQFRNVLHEKREADGYIWGNSGAIIYYVLEETYQFVYSVS